MSSHSTSIPALYDPAVWRKRFYHCKREGKYLEINFRRPSASHGKDIAHHGPWWFTPQAEEFAEIVNQACEDEPIRTPILPRRRRGLRHSSH